MAQVTMNDVAGFAQDASDYFDELQVQLNRPNPNKKAPTFSSNAIADLCHIERSQMRYLSKKHNLPTGSVITGSKAKEYSLDEAIQWVKTVGNYPSRNVLAGELARIYAVINYKGGVTKTTTAVSIAQGLSLRGLKVLLVDCDPQGSATQLLGIDPEKHIDITNTTVVPFLLGQKPDLSDAVIPTYWQKEGLSEAPLEEQLENTYLSLIPSCSYVLEAEFIIPGEALKHETEYAREVERAKREGRTPPVHTIYEFWLMLQKGIEPLREKFDCIIIDTPPSLGHLSVNVMFAADGLIMPSPPEKLDFTSSIKYWNVFQGIISYFPGADEKTYDFITILPTKVKSSEDHRLVKAQMKRAFGPWMNSIEIPESTAISQLLALDKTIFDVSKPIGSHEAYRRYKDPINNLVDYVLLNLESAWKTSWKGSKAVDELAKVDLSEESEETKQ